MRTFRIGRTIFQAFTLASLAPLISNGLSNCSTHLTKIQTVRLISVFFIDSYFEERFHRHKASQSSTFTDGTGSGNRAVGARQSINLYALRLGPEGIRVTGRSRFSASSRTFAAVFDIAIIVPIAFENLANSGVLGGFFMASVYSKSPNSKGSGLPCFTSPRFKIAAMYASSHRARNATFSRISSRASR